MTAYRAVAPRCWTQEEAWVKTANHPAPRYYVCPEHAFNIMRVMAVGDFSVVNSMKNPLSRAKYYSLFDKLKKESERKCYIGKSLRFICDFLVLLPAPSFFVEPETVRQIFHYYKKHGREFRYNVIHKEYFKHEKKKEHKD